MHDRIRISLFLLLPFLLLAILWFARSGWVDLRPISINSNGSELLFATARSDHVAPCHLICDDSGSKTSVNLKTERGDWMGVRYVTTQECVIAFGSGKFTFLDRNDITQVKATRVFDKAELLTDWAVSRNGQYFFFCCAYQRGPVYRLGIVDLSTYEIVWEPEPFSVVAGAADVGKEFFDSLGTPVSAVSHNTIVKQILMPAGVLKPVEILQFENGTPQKVSGISANGKILYCSADGAFSVVETAPNVVKIVNFRDNQSFDFKQSSSARISIASRGNSHLLIAQAGKLIVFNFETMEVENEINQLGRPARLPSIISPDGKTIARKISNYTLSWESYFKSGCKSDQQFIEVLDAATGNRIRIVEDDRSFWFWFVIAILGSLIWSVAWLWSGWAQRDTARVIGDVALISFLWLSIFFLRFLLGGSEQGLDRPSRMATLWLICGMTALIGIWFVFANLRFTFRISAALIAIVLIWVGPLLLWQHFQLRAVGMPLMFMSIAFFTLVASACFRWLGWQMTNSQRSLSPSTKRSWLQIPLSDLFLLPFAVGAMVVTTGLWPDDHSGVGVRVSDAGWMYGDVSYYLLLSLLLAAIVMVGFWAVFSVRSVPFWSVFTILLIVFLASTLRFEFWNYLIAYYPSGNVTGAGSLAGKDYWRMIAWWHVALGSGVGLHALLSMALLRHAGWRLMATKKNRGDLRLRGKEIAS